MTIAVVMTPNVQAMLDQFSIEPLRLHARKEY